MDEDVILPMDRWQKEYATMKVKRSHGSGISCLLVLDGPHACARTSGWLAVTNTTVKIQTGCQDR